ncbi:MAG TPA: RsmE family RNA methyltransferase [Gemmatimonadaceae bacterium]|nr:RsmE family RNA methyltransferase [Gemmatimonadaceae bacterium]
MERNDRAGVATFLVDAGVPAFGVARLSERAAHHARVRRLAVGDRVWLTDGAGTRANAELTVVGQNQLEARVLQVETVDRPRAIHLLAPIADRDRMLWLAEKVTELGIASWQAVRFRRSASVSPRGEGAAFGAKLQARVVSALEQSGGTWLPEILGEVEPDEIQMPPGAAAFVLDKAGTPILPELATTIGDLAIVLGPEGGIEPDEAELLAARGWRSVRLAPTTLRFETAGIAAVAIARASTLTEVA